MLRGTFLLRLLAFVLFLSFSDGAPLVWANSGGEHGGGGHGSGGAAQKKDDAKAKKRETATVTGGQGEDDPVYLHLAPVTFPIIDDNGAQQIVTLLVDLNAKDRDVATHMQNHMPKLKDAVLQALYGGMSDGSMRNAQMLDMAKIKDSILLTVNRVFGEGYVLNVLIQAVSQRKL